MVFLICAPNISVYKKRTALGKKVGLIQIFSTYFHITNTKDITNFFTFKETILCLLTSLSSFCQHFFLYSNMVNADLLPECALAIYA